MKKLLLLMLCMVLLVGTVSALEFDNWKDSYDEKTKTIVIDNAFTLGDEILSATLDTPQVNSVGLGYPKVAQFTINPKEDYTNVLGSFEFQDVNKDNEEIDVQVDIKYLSYVDKEIDTYNEVCNKPLLNGTVECNNVKTGTKIIQEEEWLPFDNNVKINQEIVIGLFTNTYEGQRVEWIPSIAGVKVSEWAVWDAGLNVGLVSYYKADRTAGTVLEDTHGANNGTISDARVLTSSIAGIINTGADFSGGDDNIDLGGGINAIGTGDLAINLWLNGTYDSDASVIWLGSDGSAGYTDSISIRTALTGDNTMDASFREGVGGGAIVTSSVVDDNMYMVTLLRNSTTAQLFINGVSQDVGNDVEFGANVSAGANAETSVGSLTYTTPILYYAYMVDEIGIWNRTLTQDEITYLYSDGDGCAFGDDTCDFTFPIVTVTNPINLSTSTTSSTTFSGTASDPVNLINVSLYIDNVLNQTNSSGFNASVYNFTVTMPEGTFDWFYSVWNNQTPPQNTNSSGMRFTVNTEPTINVFSPLNGTNQTNSTVLFMATSSLAVDNWIVNYNGTNHTLSAINTSLEVEDGTHTLLLYANNSATGLFGLNDTTTSFIVHTQEPQVRIHYPNHTFNSLAGGQSLTLNWTPYDTINLTRHITNCTYRYDNALTILNNTVCTVDNTTTFTYIANINTLNFTITDEYGLLTTNTTTWGANFIASEELFNSSDVLETDEESFFINLTTGLTIESISVFLNYNGTKHSSTSSCTGGLCQISNTIDLNKIVSAASPFENKSFFWEVNIFNGTTNNNFNTTNAEQNVSRIQFGNCGLNSALNKTLNFTFYNESDNEPLGVSTEFSGSFIYYLGSGDVTKTNQTTVTNNTVEFCVDPPEEYIVTSKIELTEAGFSSRRFDFIMETYTTPQTNKSLFLVNGTDTNVIVQVKDAGLGILRNILVEVERFFPETNTYRLVESQLTDDFGQIVAHLIENDVRYRFNFSTGLTLLKTSPDVAVACKSTICILPFVIEEEITEFDDFTELGSYTSTLSFNNATNTFTVSWDDKRGEAATFRLQVERYQLNGTSTVCNTTSTSQLSTLSCAVGDQRASYVSQFYRTPSLGSDAGEERRMIVLNAKVGDPSSTFGVEGLLWAFILLFTAVAIGSFNPTVGVGLFGFGFVMLGLMGIISMPIEVFFGVVVLCVLFVWLVRS